MEQYTNKMQELKAENYKLPDFSIFESNKSTDFSLWIPDKFYIIIGRSNSREKSVFTTLARKNNIEILKRPSGGEAVILSPKTLVIAVKITTENALNTHKYFEIINQIIISALAQLGIKHLNQKGISDISIGEKKILGSSIYRKADTVFYHAVLNVSENISTIEKYLKHPKREPSYRKGRLHSEFVTSLHSEGYEYKIKSIKKILEIKFNEKLPHI